MNVRDLISKLERFGDQVDVRVISAIPAEPDEHKYEIVSVNLVPGPSVDWVEIEIEPDYW
jgi:hypothetical protein